MRDGREHFRFGIFEFDGASGELRRNGMLVRLQAQPAQVLGVLLAWAPEPVTRDALRLAVWGEETYVDFDSGLNFCIAQIRTALGDSATSPRFVKTLPKRGYQFIAPVGTAAPQPAPRRAWLVGGAAAALVLAGGVWALWPGGRKRIAVTRFDNQTGDLALDRLADGLSDTVTVELATAGGLEVIGNAAIVRVPREQRDLNAIATTLRVGHVILGQVQRSESALRVLVHLIGMPGQAHRRVIRQEFAGTDALRMQSEIARRVLQEFVPLLSSVRK